MTYHNQLNKYKTVKYINTNLKFWGNENVLASKGNRTILKVTIANTTQNKIKP